MYAQFKKFVYRHALMTPDDRVLLGVSGGLDSVVLLHLTQRFTGNVAVAHVNYKLRGKESDNDAAWVQLLCKSWGVPCFIKEHSVAEPERGNSVQMAARALRYHWFNELAKEKQYTRIATAHHSNDQAETVLLNLVRGTGMAGLKGIPVKRMNIIRPLLFASKYDLEKYAHQHELHWREDSSNQEIKYKRNFLRKKVIPQLEELNPSFLQRFTDNFTYYQEADTVLQEYVNNFMSKNLARDCEAEWFTFRSLGTCSAVLSLLHQWLDKKGFSRQQVRDLYEAIMNYSLQTGRKFESKNYQLVVNRNELLLAGKNKDFIKLPITSETTELPVMKNLTLSHRMVTADNLNPEFTPNRAYVDSDKISYPLVLRNWQAGDWFIPFGMSGRQKLSDYLINNKVRLTTKQRTLVLCSGKDIVWLPGHRIDERFKMSSSTKRVSIFTIHYD
jgi:tRNA(Ile)-lysidine synthase